MREADTRQFCVLQGGVAPPPSGAALTSKGANRAGAAADSAGKTKGGKNTSNDSAKKADVVPTGAALRLCLALLLKFSGFFFFTTVEWVPSCCLVLEAKASIWGQT